MGIPAELLRRRPDVRRAEREAAAQSAAIGVATADLFPSFSLAGSIGVQSQELGDLFKTPDSLTGFAGPTFRWPLLNYGRLKGAVQVQEARFRQLALLYQDTVLRANREVEDALINYVKAQERVKYLTASVVAAQRSVEITHDQYRQGAVDFTPVFIFEAALTTQQDDLAQAEADIALSLVDLFRALGGGWEADEEAGTYDAPEPPAPATQRAATSRPSILGATTRP
jgi:outer membrane protein TolC